MNGERDDAVAWPGAPGSADATGSEVIARFRAGATNVRGVALLPQLHETVGVRSSARTEAGAAHGPGAPATTKTTRRKAASRWTRRRTLWDRRTDTSPATVPATPSEYVGCRRRGCYWLKTRDDADLVGVKHARKVNSFSSPPTPPSPPSATATRRSSLAPPPTATASCSTRFGKMIATAAAAGHFPLELIPASLPDRRGSPHPSRPRRRCTSSTRSS